MSKCKNNLQLSKAEINHLLNLLDANQRCGEWYGNKKQYYKRTTILIEKLETYSLVKTQGSRYGK